MEKEEGKVQDYGSHTVSITHIGNLATVGKEDGAVEEEQQQEEDDDEDRGGSSSKKALRIANRMMQKKLLASKAFRFAILMY